jgi:hypothetical protein
MDGFVLVVLESGRAREGSLPVRHSLFRLGVASGYFPRSVLNIGKASGVESVSNKILITAAVKTQERRADFSRNLSLEPNRNCHYMFASSRGIGGARTSFPLIFYGEIEITEKG